MDEIEKKVVDIIGRTVPEVSGRVGNRSDFRDELGLDSLALLEVVTTAEDEFDVRIPAYLLGDIKDVAQLVDHVRRGLAA